MRAATPETLPTLPFGRTGHRSSRLLFGAAALARVGQEEADRALPELLEAGINHIDTAASYGDAELRLAPWLKRHRADFSWRRRPASAATRRRGSRSGAPSSGWESTASTCSSSTTW